MRNSTSLSQKAGNAIEVITSLVTTLHAIWDREFVFHKRYLYLVLPSRLCICILYVYAYTYSRTCVYMRAHVYIGVVHIA